MSTGLKRSIRCAVGVGIAFAVAAVVALRVPSAWCARGAAAWLGEDTRRPLQLARGVESLLLKDTLDLGSFHTGLAQFDGEWLFGSYLMGGIGFCQLALAHAELGEWCEERSLACIDQLVTPAIRAFDAQSWGGEDPIQSLDSRHGHAAYLGYLNLLLGLHRKAFGDRSARVVALNDQVSAALARRVDASPFGLLETYPGETYPVDNCFVAGSLGLHQRVAGTDHTRSLARWVTTIRTRCIDADTGLLIQAIDDSSLVPYDAPRGSGSILGLLAVRYADDVLARELYGAVHRELAGQWLGFGTVREYAKGGSGRGDIDSGPIIFGYGMSATGFSLGAARAAQDVGTFRRLYATAHLCGVPVSRGDRTLFVSGGSLGNAILFAMLTTPPFDAVVKEHP